MFVSEEWKERGRKGKRRTRKRVEKGIERARNQGCADGETDTVEKAADGVTYSARSAAIRETILGAF
jgi:hypothetical protein